jgi:asparagine synthase (glutamine-hydrolysing)
VTRRKVSLAFLARRFVEEAELPSLQRHVAWFGLLGPRAAESAEGYLPPAVEPFWNGIEGAASPVKRAMVFDLQTYLAENLLIKLDRATMLNSIEARAPFLDRQVLDLGLRQPVDRAVGSVSTKIALKRAAEGLLPKEIIYRRKRGLSVPVADWLLGDLSAEVDELFDADRLRRQEMLRPEPVLAMLKEHRAGQADHGRRLWPLYMLQRWYRQWCES